MSNGILKEYKVHLDKLGLGVVLGKLFIKECPQSVKVSDFFVDWILVTQEVDIGSILTFSGAVLFVVGLKD